MRAQAASSRSKREWTPEEIFRAVRSGEITDERLRHADINGVVVNPETGRITLEQNPNDVGGVAEIPVGSEDMPAPIRKRTPQERVNSLMEKVAEGIKRSGAEGLLDERALEEIRLEYKWQEGKDIPMEAIRAILSRFLHLETNKAEERYGKTVVNSRPAYAGSQPR